MGKMPSQASGSGSENDDSVTAIGERGLLRDRAPEIERGFILGGRYQVEAVIGKGGSGTVLRAFDRTAQMAVAIKVLKSDLAKDERWSKRFARELRLGRPIRHPNVCRIFDITEADGHKFLTMELASGGTLRDLLKRGDPIRPLEERLADAGAAIGGLAAIHEAGIVHRDVKPDNMLRMEDGRLTLSDFGLATDLSNSQMVTVMVGTPHYMAPEVRSGEPATTRSDVWSLGVVLHEIFFGKRPERRSSMSNEGMSRPPAPLTTSAIERAMLALCERCLAENPFERPSDARAVQRLFERACAAPGLFRKAGTRGKLVLGAVAVGIVVVSLGLAQRRGHRSSATPVGSETGAIPKLDPTGEPIEWTDTAATVVTVSGQVHCFSLLDQVTARLVWGAPRRAEDVEIATGHRRRASLAAETFAVGCPELSPQKNALLFAGLTPGGSTEVRLSGSLDGTGSRSITPGAEPSWLRNGEEFLYNIDASHAAVFSLPTMSFSLLPDSGLGGRQMLSEKAASARADMVAVLSADDSSDWVVTFHEGAGWKSTRRFLLPAAYSVAFDNESDHLLVSYNLSASVSTLALLDWRAGTLRHVGKYSGFDLVASKTDGYKRVLLARRRTKDVWLHTRSGSRQVTRDGQNYSAAISPRGDLLLGKRTPQGLFSIWRQDALGNSRQLTPGPSDVRPDFSPDGTWWTYVDYARKSLVLCRTEDDQCSVLRVDEMLPTWPRFSPDGKHLAYVTQVGTGRLFVVSLHDRSVRQLGPAFSQCPPLWSTSGNIWTFEGSAKQYYWSERDSTTGARTGSRINVDGAGDEVGGAPDESRCWSIGTEGNIVLPQVRIEAEETSRLLRFENASRRAP